MSDEFRDAIFSDDNVDKPNEAPQEPVNGEEAKPDGEYVTVMGGEKQPESDKPADPQLTEADIQEELRQAKERAAYYQTLHQKSSEVLKEFDPEVYQFVKAQVKGEQPPTQPTIPQQPLQNEAAPDYGDDPVMAAIHDMKRDIDSKLTQWRAEQEEMNVRQYYTRELQTAKRALSAYENDPNLDKDLLDSIAKRASTFVDVNQPGGPTKFVQLFQEFLTASLSQASNVKMVGQERAEAAAKAKAAALVQSPSSASVPANAEKLTKEQQYLKELHEAGTSPLKADFFN